jgi:superfamily II DNA/RNA helicase
LTALPAESSAAPGTDAADLIDLTDLTGLTADLTFDGLGVPAPLVEVLAEGGITAPFPVQAATLPDALAGRDILGRARTGSGKTLGFSLPLVTRLAGGQTASGRPRGLVLVPTRELATQVQAVLRPLARAMDLWTTTIYGGVSYGPQVNALQRRTDIVVATPGRLADLISQGECDLSEVEVTVIDEADQMADLGFLPIVRRLLEMTPDHGQRMLFSATLDAAIDVLARRFLHDPALHSVDENSSPAEIEHHVLTVDPANKVAVVAALAGGEKRSLVFTRTKHGAERLARQLTEAGIPAAELHGNLRQGARSRNLAAFADGIARVMVATDIAARGIHIDGIDLVIHADVPAEHKAYVHRSGRTARAGADGVVVTMQTKGQARDVTAMMRKAGITPHEAVAANAESDVLREIAGEPAPRVSVSGKVAELVKPEDRLSANGRGGRSSRPRGDRPGRPRRDRDRDRKPREDRFRDRVPRGFERRDAEQGDAGQRDSAQVDFKLSDRDERPARFGRADRPARFDRADRPARSDHADRPARFERDERPRREDRFDRGDRYDRDERPARGRLDSDRPQRFGRDDRFDRGERGERGGFDQGERRGGFDRTDRGDRFERPARSDRFDRDDRPPRFERPARFERPTRGDRGFGNRGFGNRGFNDRGANDRGANDRGFNDRGFNDRGASDRGFGDRRDRAATGDRFERDQRPGRFDRDSRPSRGDARPGWNDRPARGGRAFGDRASGQRAFGDRASGQRAFGDRASGGRAFNDRDASGRSFGDRAPRGQREAGGERAGGPDFQRPERPQQNDWYPRGGGKPQSNRAGRPGGPGNRTGSGRSFRTRSQA